MSLPVSPITARDFDLTNASGDVCDRLNSLLEQMARMKEWFGWAFDESGAPTAEFRAALSIVAIGSIHHMPVNVVPVGYLLCDGRAVDRATYAALFQVYGTFFGAGDGSTTFNLPNRQERFLYGAGSIHGVGETGGAENVTLNESQMPSHTHRVTSNGTNDPSNGAGVLGGANDFTGPFVYDDTTIASHFAIEKRGGDQPHTNMPPFAVGIWVCKY